MNPILFALFTAGAAVFVQVLANGVESHARIRKTQRIERRILEADCGTLLRTQGKR